MNTGFLVNTRDNKPYLAVVATEKGTRFRPLVPAAKNIAKMFADEYSKSSITKNELAAALDRGMTIEGPMPVAQLPRTIKKFQASPSQEVQKKKYEPYAKIAIDAPISTFHKSDFAATIAYKAAAFQYEQNKTTFNYEVKRIRAVWDPSLAIPGTRRIGGWRCPEGTDYGGQITDEFGRNCGWGIARRIANSITSIGDAIGQVDARATDRRLNRAARREERRQRAENMARQREEEARAEQTAQTVGAQDNPSTGQPPAAATEETTERIPQLAEDVDRERSWAEYFAAEEQAPVEQVQQDAQPARETVTPLEAPRRRGEAREQREQIEQQAAEEVATESARRVAASEALAEEAALRRPTTEDEAMPGEPLPQPATRARPAEAGPLRDFPSAYESKTSDDFIFKIRKWLEEAGAPSETIDRIMQSIDRQLASDRVREGFQRLRQQRFEASRAGAEHIAIVGIDQAYLDGNNADQYMATAGIDTQSFARRIGQARHDIALDSQRAAVAARQEKPDWTDIHGYVEQIAVGHAAVLETEAVLNAANARLEELNDMFRKAAESAMKSRGLLDERPIKAADIANLPEFESLPYRDEIMGSLQSVLDEGEEIATRGVDTGISTRNAANVDAAVKSVDPLVGQAVEQAKSRLNRAVKDVVEALIGRIDDQNLTDADIIQALTPALDRAGVPRRGQHSAPSDLDTTARNIRGIFRELYDGARADDDYEVDSAIEDVSFRVPNMVAKYVYDTSQRDDSKHLVEQVRKGLARVKAFRDNQTDPRVEAQKELRTTLDPSAAKRVKSWVKAAIMRRRSALAQHIINLQGASTPLRWASMTPRKYMEMDRAEKEVFFESLYSHRIIKGTNGKYYQAHVSDVTVYANGDADSVGIRVDFSEIDENGTVIRSNVGYAERRIDVKFDTDSDGTPTSVEGGYVKNERFFLNSRSDQNSGVATILNGFAFMGLRSIGVTEAEVGAASQGQFVWARMGFGTDQPLSSTDVSALRDALRFYEIFGSGGIIRDDDEYKTISALIDNNTSDITKQDVIYALIGDTSGARNTERERQVAGFMLAQMPFSSGSRDITNEEYAGDPRLDLAERLVEAEEMRQQVEQLRDEGAPQELIDAATPPDLNDERWINDLDGRLQGIARTALPKDVVQALDRIIKQFPYDTPGMPQVIADIEAVATTIAAAKGLSDEGYAEDIDAIRTRILTESSLLGDIVGPEDREEKTRRVREILTGDPENLLRLMEILNPSGRQVLEAIINRTDTAVENGIERTVTRLDEELAEAAITGDLVGLASAVRSVLAGDVLRKALKGLNDRERYSLADMQNILRASLFAPDGSVVRQRDEPVRPQGLPASTVRQVKKLIKDAIAGRKKKVASYLVTRFGDGALPWDGMTRERFNQMSTQEKMDFLGGLYTHPRIEAANGRLYQVVARPYGGWSGDFGVAGEIFEIDEDGNRLRSVGSFDRTIKMGSTRPFVKNNSFFINGSVSDKNSGLATIVNGYAFTGLRSIGVNRASVRTGSDGPFVWARMGFRQSGGIPNYQRERLQKELDKYVRYSDTPIGIIQTPEQYFAIKDLLAQRARSGQLAKIHHQEVIFALLGSSPSKQRNADVYRWSLRNLALSSGSLTFSREDVDVDPRGVLREDSVERRGRRRRGAGEDAPPVREKPKPIAESGVDDAETPEKSIAMQEEELAEAPALTEEGLEWRANLRVRLRTLAEQYGLDYDTTFRMILDLLPADYAEAPLQVRMAMDVIDRLPERLAQRASDLINERAGSIARTILDGVFADDGTPINITPDSTDQEIDQFLRKALLFDDGEYEREQRDDYLERFQRDLNGASPIPVLNTPGEPYATGEVAETITRILGSAMNGIDYGAVANLTRALLASMDAQFAADPSRWREAVRRAVSRMRTVPRNEAGQIVPPEIVPLDINSPEGQDAIENARDWARDQRRRRFRRIADYIFDRHKDTGILPWEGMTPSVFMSLNDDQQLKYVENLYTHERIVGNDGRIYSTREIRVLPHSGNQDGIDYRGFYVHGKIVENLPDGTARYVGEFNRYVLFPEEVWGRPLRISTTDPNFRPYVLNQSLIISNPADRANGVSAVLNNYAFQGLAPIGVNTASITSTVQDGPYVWARTGFDTERGITEPRQIDKIREELAIFEAFGPGHGMGVIQTPTQYEAVRMLVAEYDARVSTIPGRDAMTDEEIREYVSEKLRGISRQDLIHALLLGSPGSDRGLSDEEAWQERAQASAEALAHERRVKVWMTGNAPLREGILRFEGQTSTFDDLEEDGFRRRILTGDRDVAAVREARRERVGAVEKVDQIRAVIKATVQARTNRIAEYISNRAREIARRNAEMRLAQGEEVDEKDLIEMMRRAVPWENMTPQRFEDMDLDERLDYLASLVEHPAHLAGDSGWHTEDVDVEETYTPYLGWAYVMTGKVVDSQTGAIGDFTYSIRKTTEEISFHGDRLFLPDSLKRKGVGTSFAGFVQEGMRAIGATTSRVDEQAQDGLHVWFRMGFDPDEGAAFQESIPEFADDLRELLVPGNPKGEELLPTETQRQALMAILNNPTSRVQEVLFGLMVLNDDGTVNRDHYARLAGFVAESLNNHRSVTDISMDTSEMPILRFDDAMERTGGIPKIDFEPTVPPVSAEDRDAIPQQTDEIQFGRTGMQETLDRRETAVPGQPAPDQPALTNQRHSMIRERIRQTIQRRQNRIAEAVVTRIDRDGRTPWDGVTRESYLAMSPGRQEAFIASLFEYTAATTGGRWETRDVSVRIERGGRTVVVEGQIADLQSPLSVPGIFKRVIEVDGGTVLNSSLLVPESLQREGVATIMNGFAQHGLRQIGVDQMWIQIATKSALPRWLQSGYQVHSRDVTGLSTAPLDLDSAAPRMREAIRELLTPGTDYSELIRTEEQRAALQEIVDKPDTTMQEILFALDDSGLVGDEKKAHREKLDTWFENKVRYFPSESKPLILPPAFDRSPQTDDEWREAAESTRIAFGPDHAAVARPRPIPVPAPATRENIFTPEGRLTERGRLESLLQKRATERGVDYDAIIKPILDALPDDLSIQSIDLGTFIKAIADEIDRSGPAAAEQIESEIREMVSRLVARNPDIANMNDVEIIEMLRNTGIFDADQDREDALNAVGRATRIAVSAAGTIAPLPPARSGQTESDAFAAARVDGGRTNREIIDDMSSSVIPYIERGARATALARLSDLDVVGMVYDAVAARDEAARSATRRAQRVVGRDTLEVGRETRQKINAEIESRRTSRDLREAMSVRSYALARFEKEGQFPWENLPPFVDMTPAQIKQVATMAYSHDAIVIGDWTYRTNDVSVQVRTSMDGTPISVSVDFEILGKRNDRQEENLVSQGRVYREITLPRFYGTRRTEGEVVHESLSLYREHRGKGLATIINGYSYEPLKALGVTDAVVQSAVSDGPYVWSRIGFSQDVDDYAIDAIEVELEKFSRGRSSNLIWTQQQYDVLHYVVRRGGVWSTQDLVFAFEVAGVSSNTVADWMESNFDWSEGRRYLGDEPLGYDQMREWTGSEEVQEYRAQAAERERAERERIEAERAREERRRPPVTPITPRTIRRSAVEVMPPQLGEILYGAKSDLEDIVDASPDMAMSDAVREAARAIDPEAIQAEIELGVIIADQAVDGILRMALDQTLESDVFRPLPSAESTLPPREVVLNYASSILASVIDQSEIGKIAGDANQGVLGKRTFDQIALRLKGVLDDLAAGNKRKPGEVANITSEIAELARTYGVGQSMSAYSIRGLADVLTNAIMLALEARSSRGETSGDGGAFAELAERELGRLSSAVSGPKLREDIRGSIEESMRGRLGVADAHMRRRFPNGTPWEGMTPRKFGAMKQADQVKFLEDVYDTGPILAPNGKTYRVVPYQIEKTGDDTYQVSLDMQVLNEDGSVAAHIGYGNRTVSIPSGVVFNNEFILYDETDKGQNLATISNHVAFTALRMIGIRRARLSPIADGKFIWSYMGFGPKPGEPSFTAEEIEMLREKIVGQAVRFGSSSMARTRMEAVMLDKVLSMPNLTHQELIFALLYNELAPLRSDNGQRHLLPYEREALKTELALRKRAVKAWMTANAPAKGTMHLSFDDLFGPIDFDDEDKEPVAWQPPEEQAPTQRNMSRPASGESPGERARPQRAAGGTRRRMSRGAQEEQEPVEPRTPVTGARILEGEQRKPELGKIGTDGLPGITSVPSGNMGIKSVDDAVAYMSGGGLLSEVPDEFLSELFSQMPQRFDVVRPGGSGINEDETRFVTDKATGAKYILKYVAGSRRYGEEMHEILGNNLLGRFGFPVASYRFAGPEYQHSPTDGPDDVAGRPILFEHVENYIANSSGRRPPWSRDWERIPLDDLVRMTLLDYTMVNQDRHGGNFWVAPDSTGNMRLVPFDHGHAFHARSGPNLRADLREAGVYDNDLASERGMMTWADDMYGGRHNNALGEIERRLASAETADEILEIVKQLRKELLDSESSKTFLQFAAEMRESAGYDNPRVAARAIGLTARRLEWLLSQDPVFIRDMIMRMAQLMRTAQP